MAHLVESMTTEAAAVPEPCFFLNLPLELRNAIYALVLHTGYDSLVLRKFEPHESRGSLKPPPALLQFDRQIRIEASAFFYKCDVVINHMDPLTEWLTINPVKASLVKSVSVEWCPLSGHTSLGLRSLGASRMWEVYRLCTRWFNDPENGAPGSWPILPKRSIFGRSACLATRPVTTA